MRVVDMHQHLWPARLLDLLRRRRRPPRLDGTALELEDGCYEVDPSAHDLEQRLAELDRDAIDVAVVSLQPTLAASFPPEIVEAWHEGMLELAERGDGRIRALAAGAVLDGFVGTSLSARDLRDLDAHAPVLEELERRGGFLFVHPGPAQADSGAPVWWAAGVDYAAQMQAAYATWLAAGVERWPNLPVVFAILAGGAPFQLERLAARGLDLRTALRADIYLETSSYGRRALELCLQTYGVRRMVYGSDTPVLDPRPMLRELRSFGDAVVTAACADNPERLLA